MSAEPERKAQLAPWKDQVANSTVLQKARQMEAVRQIHSGALVVPLRCGFCRSTNLTQFTSKSLHCEACGRVTLVETAHTLRRQEISAIIAEGVDIDVIHTTTQRRTP